MTSFKLSQILPCASFFSEGRLLLGFIVLLMQLSLVLWPAAIRLSRRTSERSGVEKLLAASHAIRPLRASNEEVPPGRLIFAGR